MSNMRSGDAFHGSRDYRHEIDECWNVVAGGANTRDLDEYHVSHCQLGATHVLEPTGAWEAFISAYSSEISI